MEGVGWAPAADDRKYLRLVEAIRRCDIIKNNKLYADSHPEICAWSTEDAPLRASSLFVPGKPRVGRRVG